MIRPFGVAPAAHLLDLLASFGRGVLAVLLDQATGSALNVAVGDDHVANIAPSDDFGQNRYEGTSPYGGPGWWAARGL